MQRNLNISLQSRFSTPSRIAVSRLVNLIFVIYWLLIFEGALRKWVMPEYKDVIFFIRVPVVLSVYVLTLYSRLWPKTNLILHATYILGLISAVLFFVQLIAGEYDFRYLLIAVHGWMNYFLYIPLAFIIADQFGKEEINRLIRQTFWLAFVAALLVIMQYNELDTHIINQGFGIDEIYQFQNLGSGFGMVRPFGFFTSTVGQQMFVASCMALTGAVWLMPKHARPVKNILLIAGTLAVLVMIILSQSRGLFFNIALIWLVTGVAAWKNGKKRLLAWTVIFPALLIFVTQALWMMVFPDALAAFSERVLGAGEVEMEYFQFGIIGRALYSFYSFVDYLQDTPLIGYLLGFGSNAASQLEWVVLPEAAHYHEGPSGWGEEGWERHIIELGPLLGVIFILFRIGLTWWLGCIALRSIRRSQDFTAILLFGFVGITLLIGQITGHGTINGYVWMFVGFCAAAARVLDVRHVDGLMLRKDPAIP
ncbi:MAG: hypothetical protein ACXWT1_18420 [Methylobacter sp.]